MYDLHNYILLSELNDSLIDILKYLFKVDGLGIVFKNEFNEKKFNEIKYKVDGIFDVFSCVELVSENKNDLFKKSKKLRDKVDVIIVNVKTPKGIRIATSLSLIDVLYSNFLDQTAARDASKNNIAFELNLSELLKVYGTKRALLISKLNFSLSLAKKYGVKILLTSGASSLFEMKTKSQIIAVAECIGLSHKEAKRSISEIPKEIIKINKMKKEGKIIGEGIMLKE